MAKILLIEDEALLSETLELLLRKDGHAVVTAANGDIGLKKFASEGPDLIITDIIMPEKEGIETIRKIRGVDDNIPIVACSGGGRSRGCDYLRMARQLGADEIIHKPFANADLLAIVRKSLEPRAA